MWCLGGAQKSNNNNKGLSNLLQTTNGTNTCLWHSFKVACVWNEVTVRWLELKHCWNKKKYRDNKTALVVSVFPWLEVLEVWRKTGIP